jgi:ABC-2 type transport system ATP-binding protein
MSRKPVAERATQLLDSFRLHDAANRPLKTYSGGMRRRLDLAAALMANPPVLFLDEPTTGLDPSGRQDLWEVIEELTAEGTTVLLTTQYLEEADRLARDIVVVDHGVVIAQGTPAELKAGLGTSVVAVTLPGSDEVRLALPLLAPLTDREPVIDGSIIELTVENGPAVGAEVLRSLDGAQIPVHGLALREPSLDDVFLSLTGHKTEAETEEEREARKAARRRRAAETDGKDAA